MRGRQWIALAAITGCADFAGIGDPKPLTDAGPDTPPVPCRLGGLDLCAFPPPTVDITIEDEFRVDTTTDCSIELFEPPAPSLCVIYGRTITVSSTLKAVGLRPLVLAATDSIQITGTVDVSSYRGGETGAAANNSSCPANGTATAAGAGGSFQGKGGDGGDDPNGPAGINAATTVAVPILMRAGCRGNQGGINGGSSGGALWLASAGTIAITSSGRVLANGAGGTLTTSGFIAVTPGGGGSGGYIRIDAPSIRIDGTVTANGGGGAEGGGTAGSDGLIGTAPAPGGSGAGSGGDGGTGGAGTMPNGGAGGNGPANDVPGGGGGGGVGFVHLIGSAVDTTVGTISPPPTLQ